MKLLSIGLLAISTLVGCGSTGGVMKLGPDTELT